MKKRGRRLSRRAAARAEQGGKPKTPPAVVDNRVTCTLANGKVLFIGYKGTGVPKPHHAWCKCVLCKERVEQAIVRKQAAIEAGRQAELQRRAKLWGRMSGAAIVDDVTFRLSDVTTSMLLPDPSEEALTATHIAMAMRKIEQDTYDAMFGKLLLSPLPPIPKAEVPWKHPPFLMGLTDIKTT